MKKIPRREWFYFSLVSILLFFPHEAFECAELTFECLESILDHLVEFLFETGTHDTQVIVFNLLFFAVLGYSVWRVRKWYAQKGGTVWNKLTMKKFMGRWYVVVPVVSKIIEIGLL